MPASPTESDRLFVDPVEPRLGSPRPAEQLGPTYDPEAALRNEDGSLDGGALTAS